MTCDNQHNGSGNPMFDTLDNFQGSVEHANETMKNGVQGVAAAAAYCLPPEVPESRRHRLQSRVGGHRPSIDCNFDRTRAGSDSEGTLVPSCGSFGRTLDFTVVPPTYPMFDGRIGMIADPPVCPQSPNPGHCDHGYERQLKWDVHNVPKTN